MSSTVAPAGVLSFEQAFKAVVDYGRKLAAPQVESAVLLESLGRVLAAPVLADRDFPPFPRATRDGYALRAADLKTTPATLRVSGQVKAGAAYAGQVPPGEAVEIMTGAAVPQGADTVVMVEYTSLRNGSAKSEDE